MRGLILVLVLFPAISLAQTKPLPDAPKPKINKSIFWTGVSALAASQTFDAIETRNALNKGWIEYNPIFGNRPSPAKQAAINGAFFLGQSFLFYKTEQHRKWRWIGRVSLSLSITEHIRYGACNATMKVCYGNGLL